MSEVIDGQIVDDVPAAPAADPLSKEQRDYVESLRMLADFYEQRPGMPLLYMGNMHSFCDEKDLPKVARLIGACEKTVLGDQFFCLRKKFPAFEVNWSFSRDTVCERVVVGRETVEEKVPVTYETRTVTRDKVEWHCPKSIIDRPQIAMPPDPVPAPDPNKHTDSTTEDIPF